MPELPPYISFPSLIGDTVYLSAIELADIQDIIEISFYDAIQATTLEEASKMQVRIHKDYIDGNSIHWGIFDKASNKIVGTCGYYRGLSEGAGELGCVLLAKYYGKGFMTSAMLLAMEFGKNAIKLDRIYAITSCENQKAIQLLERLQFKKVAELDEGYLEFEWK